MLNYTILNICARPACPELVSSSAVKTSDSCTKRKPKSNPKSVGEAIVLQIQLGPASSNDRWWHWLDSLFFQKQNNSSKLKKLDADGSIHTACLHLPCWRSPVCANRSIDMSVWWIPCVCSSCSSSEGTFSCRWHTGKGSTTTDASDGAMDPLSEGIGPCTNPSYVLASHWPPAGEPSMLAIVSAGLLFW